MSNPWDLDYLRKIAGLEEVVPARQALNESWDEGDTDDDDDEDVKKADQEAKKRNIKLPKVKVNPEKDLHDLARSRKHREEGTDTDDSEADNAAKKATIKKKTSNVGGVAQYATQQSNIEKEKKKNEPIVKKTEPVEKKEESSDVEKKKRGKVQNPASKTGQLRAWVADNPGKKRSEAWAYAQTIDPPFTKAGFSTIYQSIKNKIVKECFILRHPTVPSFILHENTAMNMYQWISNSDLNQEPLVLATEAEAIKIANYLKSFKNQLSDIERIDLED